MGHTPAQPPIDFPLTLSDDFDPALLPVAAPPVEGVRPWQWLADRQTPEEDWKPYLSRFVRGHGTVDPSDRCIGLQPRDRADVIAQYLDQEVFLDLPGEPGVRLRVTTADELDQADSPVAGLRFPFTGPVAFVGTTAPTTAAPGNADEVGRVVAEELRGVLHGRGCKGLYAWAADRDREWIDPLLVTPGGDLRQIGPAAAALGLPFLAVWRPDPALPWGVIEILDVTQPELGEVVASRPAQVHRVEVRTCPLIPGSQCGDLCRVNGGPWVSRSITAAFRWQVRRFRILRALGCDTCGDAEIRVGFGRAMLAGQVGTAPRSLPGAPPPQLLGTTRDPAATRYDRLVPIEEEPRLLPPDLM